MCHSTKHNKYHINNQIHVLVHKTHQSLTLCRSRHVFSRFDHFIHERRCPNMRQTFAHPDPLPGLQRELKIWRSFEHQHNRRSHSKLAKRVALFQSEPVAQANVVFCRAPFLVAVRLQGFVAVDADTANVGCSCIVKLKNAGQFAVSRNSRIT